MKRDPIAYTTRRIVSRLFVRNATRLALRRRDGDTAWETDLGGWCKSAVRDIVREELECKEAREIRQQRKAKP